MTYAIQSETEHQLGILADVFLPDRFIVLLCVGHLAEASIDWTRRMPFEALELVSTLVLDEMEVESKFAFIFQDRPAQASHRWTPSRFWALLSSTCGSIDR